VARPPRGKPTWDGAIPGLLALLLALVVLLFHVWGNTYAGLDAQQSTRSIFVWLTQRWNDSALSFGGNYSHGWLVPLVSLWLVWHRRRDLRAMPRASHGAGLAVIAAALALHWVGARGELPQLSVVAFIGLLWGVPFYLFGRPTARILFFPCAYLLFAVPVGFLDNLTFPLRMLATVISGGLLNGFGIPVVRIGTALHSTLGHGFSLDVADPCSGIRSLAAMMAVTAAYAYVTQPTLGRKWVLFLSAIPLAVIGNIGRILAIGIVAALFGMEAAMGLYHDYSGYVLYAFAIGSMLLVDHLLNRRAPARPAPSQAEPRPESRPPAAKRAARDLARPCLLVIGLMALMIGILSLTAKVAQPGRLALKAELPATVGEWRGEELRFCQNPACLREFALSELAEPVQCPACGGALDTLAYAERQLLPADTLLVRKRYARAGWPPLFVAIVFSGGSRSSIHRPEICTLGQGFETTHATRFAVPLAGRAPLQVTGIDLKKVAGRSRPADSVYLAYWFEGGLGRETPSHTRRILWMAADRILHGNPTRWAYVLIQMPGSVPASTTHQRVSEFIRHLQPLLQVAPALPGPATSAP
jgi:exosortase